jgi:hypothetical protein
MYILIPLRIKLLITSFFAATLLTACTETTTSVSEPPVTPPTNGSPQDPTPPYNLQQTQRLQGTWTFTYTILSTWTDTYALRDVTESTVNPGEFVIFGTDTYGDIVIAGYAPSLSEFTLLDTGSIIDQFYTFNFTAADSVAGCYYLIDLATDEWSECYSMQGDKISTPLATSSLFKQKATTKLAETKTSSHAAIKSHTLQSAQRTYRILKENQP